MRLPRALGPLRHRPFRLLAAGQLTSNVGDAFYAVALPWFVLATHGGVLLLGTVLAAYGVPRVALLAVGGQLSDRWGPWTVMMVADVVRAAATAALAGVALSGPASAALLVPVAVVLGAGEGLFLPGSFAIVPTLLPDDDLQAGNALVSAGTQLATLIGPAVGGAVVAIAGPGPAFVVDAASFLVSASSLAGIRASRTKAAAAAPPEVASDVAEATDGVVAGGLPTLRQLLASERVLQVILLVTLAANLGSGGLSEVALPALVRGPFHGGAGGFGALIAAFGGGALLGTVLSAQARRSARPAIVGSVTFLLEAGFIAIVPYLGGIVPAGIAIALVGACNGFGNVVMITNFQRWAPPALLGRLMGVLMIGSFGVFPLSVLIGGAIVHTWGAAIFFPLAGGVIALAVLAGLTQPSWRGFGATEGRGGGVAAPEGSGAAESMSFASTPSRAAESL